MASGNILPYQQSIQFSVQDACLKDCYSTWLRCYEFTAYCGKVYDGDTCTIYIKLMPNDDKPTKLQLRMLGYDAPEIKSHDPAEKQEAIKMRIALADLILYKFVFVVVDKKPDKYGRLLATVYVKWDGNHSSSISEIDIQDTSKLLNVNKRMMLNSCCKPYYGGKKTPFKQDVEEHVIL